MLLDILRTLVPNAQVVIVGEPSNADEYSTQVEWLDERPQPTWAQIETVRSDVEKAITNANVESERRATFQIEADPLFFGWQRGENTEQAWRDKCDEIRARYPYR